jgi:RNA polymerase sigma-32 factor
MTNALVVRRETLPVVAGDLDAYTQAIQAFPVLDAQQEKELALKLKKENDLDAAKALVMHNLRFVIKVARGYNGYGLPLPDLVQEGSIGLMKAVKRFDPDMNVRLISFAVHWIRAEIHEYILRNWKIVKVATTKSQRKLFFNLRSSKNRLGWLNKEEVDSVASDLNVSSKDVLEMEKRLSGQDISFDLSASDDDEQAYSPSQYLTNEADDPADTAEAEDWNDYTQNRFYAALETLDERSKDILAKRWLAEEKATLQELADQYGVSAERIRQLENTAIKKLKVSVEDV